MKTPAVLLGVAAVASGLILIWPRADPVEVRPATPSRAPPPAAAPITAVTASPAAQAIAFAPQSAADLPATTPPIPVAPPALVGVTMRPRPIAYVMMAGRPWRAGLGDKVASWRVVAIGEKSVRLRRGGRTLSLSLYGPRPAPPPPPRLTIAPAETQPVEAATPAPPAQAAAASPTHVHMPPPPANAPRYWVGPPGSAPPGFTPLPASALPPPTMRR
jgi:hypothetical protein